MVSSSPWVTSLYCSLVVGSVKVLCYCKILYLIKKMVRNQCFSIQHHQFQGNPECGC